MPEYIEREALVKELNKAPANFGSGDIQYGLLIAKGIAEKQPTADVAEVVRCKDCVNWGGVIFGFVCRKFSGLDTKICMYADNFCSYGERKPDAR